MPQEQLAHPAPDLATNTILQLKKPGFFGETDDSKIGHGLYQMNWEHFCSARKQDNIEKK